jgi:transposase
MHTDERMKMDKFPSIDQLLKPSRPTKLPGLSESQRLGQLPNSNRPLSWREAHRGIIDDELRNTIVEMHTNGSSYRNIAKELGISVTSVGDAVRKHSPNATKGPRRLTIQDEQLIVALKNSGHTLKEICERTSVGTATIYRVLERSRDEANDGIQDH